MSVIPIWHQKRKNKKKESKKYVKKPSVAKVYAKTSDSGKAPNQVEGKNIMNKDTVVRSTARSTSRGKIDFYVKQTEKVRSESRGSKRGSSSPLKGAEKGKTK